MVTHTHTQSTIPSAHAGEGNNFVILYMGLESLESALKSASFDTKITSIAHVEPENNTLQWHSLIINTFIAQWRSLHSTQLTPFTFDEVRNEHEQTIVLYSCWHISTVEAVYYVCYCNGIWKSFSFNLFSIFGSRILCNFFTHCLGAQH